MISVLYDNYGGEQEDLRSAWGFSALVEGYDRTVLFDTGGDGGILLHNMKVMEVDPWGIDALVLSHEHWDHTGGLQQLLGRSPDLTVYMPGAFPAPLSNMVRELGAALHETAESTEVCPGVWTTRCWAVPYRSRDSAWRGRGERF